MYSALFPIWYIGPCQKENELYFIHNGDQCTTHFKWLQSHVLINKQDVKRDMYNWLSKQNDLLGLVEAVCNHREFFGKCKFFFQKILWKYKALLIKWIKSQVLEIWMHSLQFYISTIVTMVTCLGKNTQIYHIKYQNIYRWLCKIHFFLT